MERDGAPPTQSERCVAAPTVAVTVAEPSTDPSKKQCEIKADLDASLLPVRALFSSYSAQLLGARREPLHELMEGGGGGGVGGS